ncbi:hypothetical protein MMYC01_201287 [Madurella mycetomatis]|uniref:Calcineurin-like phosphoesterase domain-containing protein n=1 Tax=Madurella mycetomatis TaxID=100816 RepID=A0A175WHL5_9PEZI|nr:hypothetical protein MMYC01_201287 [Madurella mycetomatis]
MGEFRTSLELLQAINASLKLVIAGNHDFTLETHIFRKIVAGVDASITPEEIKGVCGDFGDAERLFVEASHNGIVFLSEGIHHFNLQNGASLAVYTSPFTLSKEAGGGFQFKRGEYHDFTIGGGRAVDVVPSVYPWVTSVYIPREHLTQVLHLSFYVRLKSSYLLQDALTLDSFDSVS